MLSGEFPQTRIGGFDTILIKEFLAALADRAAVALHCVLRYGENSHHMAESLFKALGKAIQQAYGRSGTLQTTKGTLGP